MSGGEMLGGVAEVEVAGGVPSQAVVSTTKLRFLSLHLPTSNRQHPLARLCPFSRPNSYTTNKTALV